MSRCYYVDARPVLDWLDQDVLPRYDSLQHLAVVLGQRSGLQAMSWQRQLHRWRSRATIEFFALDRLCVLLGEHVSRFCDLNEFVQEQP